MGSLCCYECGQSLEPSEFLPGREGGAIFPNVVSAVWIPESEGEIWAPAFVKTSTHLSVCFECVIKKLFDGKTNALNSIFNAYESEAEFQQQKMGSETRKDAYNTFQKKLRAVPQDICLSCSKNLSESRKTFFSFKALNQVKSRQEISLHGTYSSFGATVGMVSFGICFDCCKNSFPRIFRQLSYMLRGKKDPKANENATYNLLIFPKLLNVLKVRGYA